MRYSFSASIVFVGLCSLACGGAEKVEWSPVHSRWLRTEAPDNVDPEVWVLLPKGALLRPQGRATDEWSRQDSQLTIEINEGYATYEGTILGEHSIVGTRKTEKGTVDFRLSRLPSPSESLGFGDFGTLPDTYWEVFRGTANTPEYHFLFRPHGGLEFSGDRNAMTDGWELQNGQLTVQLNDYATYTGTLIDGHTWVGTAKTETKSWPFWAQRLPSPAELDCDADESEPFVVAGSHWRGSRSASPQLDEWIDFLPGGRLLYSGDRNAAKDVWEQQGTTIRFQKNDGFVTYTGNLVGDHTIVATARNVDGKSWTVRLTRVPSQAELHCPPTDD